MCLELTPFESAASMASRAALGFRRREDEDILSRRDPCNFSKTDFETHGIIIVRPVFFF